VSSIESSEQEFLPLESREREDEADIHERRHDGAYFMSIYNTILC